MSDKLQRAGGGFFSSLLKSRAQRVSERNRGIHEYKPNAIDAFLQPEMGVYNVAASGGSAAARNSVVCAQIDSAWQNRLPVVILHEGDRLLEDTIRARFAGHGEYAEVSRARPAFEPMYGLAPLEIANEVIQSATKDYDIKYNARYYLDGVSELMHKMGKRTSFKMFATCPHLQIFDKVDDARVQGKITDAEAQQIKSKLMMGQTENLKLDSYFSSVELEIAPILWNKSSGLNPVSVFSAIRDRKILLFDVMSVNSVMLMNMLVYQLDLASARGLQYVLVLDGLPINANQKYGEFLKKASSNIAWTVVSDDLLSTVGGDERLFGALVGNSLLTVIMSHASGKSASKWAEVIGMCDVWNESYSNSFTSQTNLNTIWNTYSSGTSRFTHKAREFIVQPEFITRMQPNEAYIISRPRQEIAHLLLTP